jgi:bleomycin hydrolase
MNRNFLIVLILVVAGFSGISRLHAQSVADTVGGYIFTDIKIVPHTPVKNQNQSGTCWSYAGTSLVEAEVLRQGGPELDLAEMWPVRYAYEKRADGYVRLHGNFNFSPGGEPHQVMETLADRGLVPEEAYNGLTYGEDKHVHGEMDHVLQTFVKAITDNENRKLTPVWMTAYDGILDAYLGAKPENFTWNGKSYTPKSFAQQVVKINPADYVEVTSYSSHPYYKNFLLLIPDNWDYELYYNVKIEDLTNIIDMAINNGYTVAWAADVSDPGFSHKKGLALVPEKEWSDIPRASRDSVFDVAGKQRVVTAEMRQQAYDNYSSTDDHSMHIIGMAKDQDGNTWYKVKNSWGADSNDFGGYLYVSQPYMQLNTLAIYVNRSVVPQGTN